MLAVSRGAAAGREPGSSQEPCVLPGKPGPAFLELRC